MVTDSILEAKNISKRYGSFEAVSNIDFTLKKGEIHSIIGANGAGKSTFVKLLYGEILPSEGDFYFNGKCIKINSPKDAIKNKISIVPQDFGLIDCLTVLENINIINKKKSLLFCTSKFDFVTTELLKELSINLAVDKKVSELSVSEKQIVSIAKALNSNSRILIFDEPTSVLTANSFKILKQIILNLKSAGKSIIYITHKIDEVFEIADTVSVFQDSKIVFSGDIKKIKREELLRYYNTIPFSEKEYKYISKCPLLNVEKISTKNLNNISFSINEGESIGIISNNYIESVELVKAIFGIVHKTTGVVKVRNKSLNNPIDCINNKIGFIPEDRRSDSIFNNISISDNISIMNFRKLSKWGIINIKDLSENVSNKIQQLKIKCQSILQSPIELSGGNQQKMLFAKWISYDFSLLILIEPTAGIDLGGKSEIYSLMSDLKQLSKSFIVVSSDFDEIKSICDKIILLKDGELKSVIETQEFNKRLYNEIYE